MAKREVVNDEDVEKKKQLGKPEVIEEQEQAYFSEKLVQKELFFYQNNYSVILKNLKLVFLWIRDIISG